VTDLRRPLVLVATSLAAFTATLDNTVVAVALRDLQADLGAGVAELQGVVTAYTVALAALLLTGGTLADVAGRRRVFVAGLAVFGAASAACALAESATALIAARAVQGAGAALVLPGGLAVLAAAYPEPGPRARAVGLWAATGAAALVLGPVVGGLLVAASGWPAVFWVNVPLCIAVAAVVLLVAPTVTPPACLPAAPAAGPVSVAVGRRAVGGRPRRGLDLPGQLLGALALAAGTYAVVLAGRDGFGTPVAVTTTVAVLAAVGFVLVERRTPDPVLPLELLGSRAFVGATVGAFAASLAVFVLLVFVSLFLQLVQQREALPAALRLLPLTVALVVTAPLAGRWAAARGPRVPVVAGLLLTAVGLALTGWRLDLAMSDVELAVLLTVCGLGIGLTTAPVVTASLDAVARSRSGWPLRPSTSPASSAGWWRSPGWAPSSSPGSAATSPVSCATWASRPAGPRCSVEALLRGATNNEVIRLAEGQVPLDVLLRLRPLAEVSYVGSVRLALLGAALVAPAVRRADRPVATAPRGPARPRVAARPGRSPAARRGPG
jgi:DHA2 family methylenomycin A resistance protein-like MFS transporter